MSAFDEHSDSLSFSNSKVDHEGIASVFAHPTHLLIRMKSDIKPSEKYPEMFPESITTIVLDVDGMRYEYSAKEVLALLDWWIGHRNEQFMPEHTCHIANGECDQCGAWVRDKPVTYWIPTGKGINTAEKHDARFCPSCGAKVVDE